MKILTLIIKGIYLDQIVAGTKPIETRDVRPNTFNKYYEYDNEGEFVGLRFYDAIQFYAGYNKDRKAALVEVLSYEAFEIVDEDTKEPVTFMYQDEEYNETIIEFSLGKVINTVNYS